MHIIYNICIHYALYLIYIIFRYFLSQSSSAGKMSGICWGSVCLNKEGQMLKYLGGEIISSFYVQVFWANRTVSHATEILLSRL